VIVRSATDAGDSLPNDVTTPEAMLRAEQTTSLAVEVEA
jgi:hypothetical protein